ncbi:MAG: phosphate ABC transporter permease PstA [Coriobacteriales bacterium]|nr:phosphate ABC transporter permease PstA [Coriobacteriales bacterium]
MRSRLRAQAARGAERVAKFITGAALILAVGSTLAIMLYILVRGLASISPEFIFGMPKKNMTAGGIWPALVGTIYLTIGTAIFALPVGIFSGIYLAEFSKGGRVTRVIRISIANMAGVPSIVYGLFGYAAFSILLGFGKSLLSGALTLAAVTLPVVITATEEALRQVPKDLRQASLALGASRLGTVFRVVLPAAAPGIITGSILGLSRAAGETAPILVTAVAFAAPIPKSVFQPTMALPYHLYIMATQPVKPAPHIVWGTALVLVAGVSIINVAAAAWRSRQRSKIRW